MLGTIKVDAYKGLTFNKIYPLFIHFRKKYVRNNNNQIYLNPRAQSHTKRVPTQQIFGRHPQLHMFIVIRHCRTINKKNAMKVYIATLGRNMIRWYDFLHVS